MEVPTESRLNGFHKQRDEYTAMVEVNLRKKHTHVTYQDMYWTEHILTFQMWSEWWMLIGTH